MSFDPWQVAACFLGGIIFGFVWPGVWKSLTAAWSRRRRKPPVDLHHRG